MTNVNRLCILFGAESDPALFDDEDEELAPSREQANNPDRSPSPARPVGQVNQVNSAVRSPSPASPAAEVQQVNSPDRLPLPAGPAANTLLDSGPAGSSAVILPTPADLLAPQIPLPTQSSSKPAPAHQPQDVPASCQTLNSPAQASSRSTAAPNPSAPSGATHADDAWAGIPDPNATLDRMDVDDTGIPSHVVLPKVQRVPATPQNSQDTQVTHETLAMSQSQPTEPSAIVSPAPAHQCQETEVLVSSLVSALLPSPRHTRSKSRSATNQIVGKSAQPLPSESAQPLPSESAQPLPSSGTPKAGSSQGPLLSVRSPPHTRSRSRSASNEQIGLSEKRKASEELEPTRKTRPKK